MEYSISVYRCDTCGKISHDASNMRRHACPAPMLRRLAGRVLVDTTTTPAAAAERSDRPKPGPKPIVPSEVLRGAIASRDEESDDARIDHMFASGLIADFLKIRDVHRIPAFLFEHLWGTRAPRRMQSMFVLKNMVYEVESADPPPEDSVTVTAPCKFAAPFSRDLAVYLLEFAYSVCLHSVPARMMPDEGADASRILEMLRGSDLRNKLRVSGRLEPRSRGFVDEFHAAVVQSMPSAFKRA